MDMLRVKRVPYMEFRGLLRYRGRGKWRPLAAMAAKVN